MNAPVRRELTIDLTEIRTGGTTTSGANGYDMAYALISEASAALAKELSNDWRFRQTHIPECFWLWEIV